ncbi:MAG: ATP-binding cassette domain-containing protein [Deltaproteobacteria bacterium]|nr:ATP-binding cassette domain-containing protein [Deltaproteobacteria bacterium]
MITCTDLRLSISSKIVLDDINVSFKSGEIWGIIGPPGAGKTVLIKVIAGLYTPQFGTVEIDGDEISSMKEEQMVFVRRKIGMLFQNNALFDFMTVGENVAFPLARANPDASSEQIRKTALERLKDVGLLGSENKFPSELSGGMRKRVGVARAIITEPPVVIYDEPTAGLDPVTTSKIYDLLTDIQARSNSAVIAISSDISGLRTFVKNILFLHRGKVLFSGRNEDIDKCEDPVVYQFLRGLDRGPL